jgi:ubiquitin-activating enzyme E1
VKIPQELKFKKLSDALLFPLGDGKYEIDTADFSKDPNLLHLTLLAVFEFVKKHKELPRLNNAADANELLSLTNELNENNKKKMDIEGLIKVEKINEDVVKNVASFARAQISSTVSFWGGIVAQEIVKYTGKILKKILLIYF